LNIVFQSKPSWSSWISLVFVVVSPFPSLILLIWVFFLLFLVRLAKDLSILPFWRTNFLFNCWYRLFSVSISLTSVLILIISFYLLIWGLANSYFSRSLMCIIRLFIWDLSSFLLLLFVCFDIGAHIYKLSS
jgi:hypothetical protein